MVVLSDVLRTDIESRGSTTWKKRSAGRGTEPDSCFYVANAARILGKRRLDIARDPPPDLVVEIDVTSRSLGKFPTYAAFRVPEIWRYLARKGRLEFYGLSDRKYVVISSSLSFPILTPRALEAFIEQSKTEGQTAAAAAFRRWLRGRMRSKRK
jgi:Uma2 family endonuclease